MSEVDLSLARSTAAALRANGTAGGYWPRTTRIDPAGANRVEIDLLPDGKGFSLPFFNYHAAARCTTRECEGRCPHPSSHVLFTSGDAWSARAGHPGIGWTSRFGDDAALHAPEPGSDRRRNRTFGDEVDRSAFSEWRNSGGGGKTEVKESDDTTVGLPAEARSRARTVHLRLV